MQLQPRPEQTDPEPIAEVVTLLRSILETLSELKDIVQTAIEGDS